MKFEDLIKERQSIRKYTSQPVEKDKLIQCVEAARLAPSAHNTQPWKFIIVDDVELKNNLAACTTDESKYYNKWTPLAPVIVVLTLEESNFTSRESRSVENKDWPLIDIGIAVEHFCLQATELDLSTCILGWFYEKPVKELLNIPEEKTVALMITVGYAPSNFIARAKKRKPIKEVMAFNTYSE